MTNEYLTGAELMYAIGDAMAAGEGPEVFEIWTFDGWQSPNRWEILMTYDRSTQIRRKPRMRHLVDYRGIRREWPEPMQRQPKWGEEYYSPISSWSASAEAHTWRGNASDYHRFNNGQCHAKGSNAKQHAEALIAASGGTCE